MTFNIGAGSLRNLGASVLLCAAMGLGSVAHAQDQAADDGSEVVATVDGVDITKDDVRLAVGEMGEVLRQVPPNQQGEYLISFLIDIALVSREAEKDGLDDGEAFKRQMAFSRNKALVQAKLAVVGEEAVTDEAVEARYQDAIKDFEAKEEVRARHILVESEEKAKELKAELDGGADFEALAAEHSTDGSKANGGDLGYFSKDMVVAPFGEAAFSTEPGSVTDPVQSKFGWHIIKVEDKRMSAPPPLDSVRKEIEQEVRQLARRDYVQSLRDGADIERPGEEAEAAPEGDAPKTDAPKTE
ncbi:peptidylprolyl isomerase [Tepidamorphus sp. 3E244]|uniref:peptidylprolyl isomerase n=1 Tax=Tepidamorphus sp. 3E244 TaxID=3385498 RepID=UPI0038FCFF95